MFFYSGTKLVESHLGTVADFCQMCRGVRRHAVLAVRKVHHIYGAATDRGVLISNIRRCSTCGVTLAANIDQYKDVIKRPKKLSDEELAQKTFPHLNEFHAKRLQIESLLRQQQEKLDPNTRAALLVEPFDLMDPIASKRLNYRITRYTVLLGIVLFFGVMMLMGQILEWFPSLAEQTAAVAIGSLIPGIAILIAQVIWAERRFMRKKIYPYLASSLVVLAPSLDEFQSVKTRLKNKGALIGKYVDVAALSKTMENLPRNIA